MPQRGLNLSRTWYDRIKAYYESKGFAPRNREQLASMLLDEEVQKLKNLTPEEKASIIKSVKEGGDIVLLHPKVKGRGVAIHETMHTLTGKELGKELLKQVGLDKVMDLIYDSKESTEHNISDLAENLGWITRGHEYYTEVMTQYFMGNLKTGTKSFRLAEAILRNSSDPQVRDLVGASLGVVLAYGLSKRLQDKQAN